MRVARLSLVLAAVVLAGSLIGCRDTNRPTSYEKGVYGGKPDQKLTPEQLRALRQRGAYQK